MKEINSIKDENFVLLSKAVNISAKNAGKVVLDSIPLLEAAIYADLKVPVLLWDEREINNEHTERINQILSSRGSNIFFATFHYLKRLNISNGIPKCVFIVEKKEEELYIKNIKADSDMQKLIVLADVLDPMNVGSIIRHGEAFGYTAVAAGATPSMIGRQIIRSSTGSAIRKKLFRSSQELPNLYEGLKSNGYQVITTSAHAATSLENFLFKLPHAVFIGNETHGLPVEFRNMSENDIAVSMVKGGAHSINAASASSIIMYSGMIKTL